MPAGPAHYATILKFWRSVETFTLPDIPTGKRSDHIAILRPGMALPWEPGRLPSPIEGRQWRHTLYFHIVAKETVIDLLARLTHSTEFREPVGGDTCLSALALDTLGAPSSRTYSPAAFIYGIKLIREKRNPEVLVDWLNKAQEDYLTRFGLSPATAETSPLTSAPLQNVPTPLTWASLQKELDHLQKISHNALQTATPIRCISEEVSLNAAIDAPFLNSYYLTDLDTLIRHPHDIGRPLQLFLSPEPPLADRIDLLEPKVLFQHIQHPPPPGRWPSDPRHSLYSAQYAAQHIALSGQRQQHGPTANPAPQTATHPSLLAINGPPGTGKTTLLREIIANNIVKRAHRLLTTGATGLFQTKRLTIADRTGYYRPESSVITSDGIVISGNNNSAIENISRELPLVQNIHRNSFPDAQYFSPFATTMLGEPSWGLISAALGRSQKRSDFIDKFWFNKMSGKYAPGKIAHFPQTTNVCPSAEPLPAAQIGKGFGRWLKEQYEDHAQARSNTQNYEATASRLRSLFEEYENFSVHESLPGRAFLQLSREDMHRFTPYASEKLNTLRSELFLCSLQLHEWAIRCNARYFYHNLSAFIDMLSGKWKEQIDATIAADLWNSFFFCVPVVSVTLASFHRQFHNMGQGSIGWLLLDEAGQATPPSVCGALWRCRQCILIGDTRQIPPVVTIPRTLGRLLEDMHGIRNDNWSPLIHSAQSLADRITATGTRIDDNNSDSIWTGIPLRAHRRCQEPMFSIANSIAYNAQMVQATPIPTGASAMRPICNGASFPTGAPSPSGWIDIRGFTSLDGHAIAEEIQVVADLLLQLTNYSGSIFIISPFRSIAGICRNQFQTGRIACGTIHTFQGKEADTVILVLGTLPRSILARNWVAASPNILNVAVTRARGHLYVIGNRNTWSAHNYFNHLASHLPVKPHFSGRLF